MKATELMVGDWVHVNPISRKIEGHNSIVGALSRQPNDEIQVEGFYNGHFGWCVNLDDVEPIPLNEDILKANGFERNVLCAGDYYFAPAPDMHDVIFHVSEDTYEDTWHVETLVDHNDNEYALFNVCHVHELQHILRICGLTELADNFKLAK